MVHESLAFDFDQQLIDNVHVSKHGVDARVKTLLSSSPVTEDDNLAAWLLMAVSMIDLTTLAGDDTCSNVQRLCIKASQPLSRQVYRGLGFEEWTEQAPVTTAAVCVYPSRVSDAARFLRATGFADRIQVAAGALLVSPYGTATVLKKPEVQRAKHVGTIRYGTPDNLATGFPSGQYSLASRLQEVHDAVAAGATEVDVVVDRSLVLAGRWRELHAELKQMRAACGVAALKVILAVGELATYTNVYKASLVAMSAGADFIKTSTGKESVNATLAVGLVMCRAIRSHHRRTGLKVGLKPAGGIRTASDAVAWLVIVKEELGAEWLRPQLFRIGASGLLGALERHLHDHVSGVASPADTFSFM